MLARRVYRFSGVFDYMVEIAATNLPIKYVYLCVDLFGMCPCVSVLSCVCVGKRHRNHFHLNICTVHSDSNQMEISHTDAVEIGFSSANGMELDEGDCHRTRTYGERVVVVTTSNQTNDRNRVCMCGCACDDAEYV